MTGAAALPANLKAEMTEVAPARLAGTASMVSVLSPAQISDDAAPAASHSSARPATAAGRADEPDEHGADGCPGDGHGDPPDAVDKPPRRAPGDHAGDPEAGQHRAARARAEIERVAAAQRDEEAEAGDARVARERGR